MLHSRCQGLPDRDFSHPLPRFVRAVNSFPELPDYWHVERVRQSLQRKQPEAVKTEKNINTTSNTTPTYFKMRLFFISHYLLPY